MRGEGQTTEIVRPNGRTYVARKAPEASVYDDLDGDAGGVVVVRTHNAVLARAIAIRLLNEFDLTAFEPEKRWWRLAMRDGGRQWVDDPERGAPALVWSLDEALDIAYRQARTRMAESRNTHVVCDGSCGEIDPHTHAKGADRG